MSIQQMLLGGSLSGYLMDKSLRFRASASAYLNKTIGVGGTNNKHVTSFWMKRGAISTAAYTVIYSAGTDANNYIYIWLAAADKIGIYWQSSGSPVLNMQSTMVLRDPSSWYHIYFAQDTTQATAANRFKLWINGAEVTSWSTNTNSTTQNAGTPFGGNNVHNIGRDSSTSSNYFDGYIAEFNDIWQPSTIPPVTDFGSTNALTGVWQPKAYTGTYGINGFYLDFEDTSSVAALGTDSSGNGNNWTVNNVSLTAGVTYDSMTDVPTLTSATVANYAVLNPLNSYSSSAVIEGNLVYSSGTAVNQSSVGSIYVSTGKWYAEITLSGTSNSFVGIAKDTFNAINTATYIGATADTYGYFNTGQKANNATLTSYGASWTNNDVIGVALDLTAGTLTFYKNNVSQGVAFTGLSGNFSFAQSVNATTLKANFGQRPFAYTPPTGFVALNAFNLPTATILKGSTVMDATLYTGNGSTQTITNAGGFQPDLVWVKSRSAATDNALYDSVRGVQKQIESNNIGAETTETTGLTAFNSTGFAIGALAQMNTSAATYVGWQWQAGQGSSSSNTDGTITSTVSVNPTAGFSVVTYTGNATAGATVGHGLGVAPAFIIAKARGVTSSWSVYHQSLGASQYILLNGTAAAVSSTQEWGGTAPTSSVITIGNASANNNQATANVLYAFAQIAEYSAFGKYQGNSSADGVFVYTGFRPKLVIVRPYDGAADWILEDTSRSPYNVSSATLYPNSSGAEASGTNLIDFLSNGFKLRTASGNLNSSSNNYLYAAFAENPFKNSLAR